MSKPTLIFLNPSILFVDDALAVYPRILNELGRGTEARALQEKYEAGKLAGPLLLPEMIKLFLGKSEWDIHKACWQYCFEFLRREVSKIFFTLQSSSHQCVFVTSLPREICDNIWKISCGQLHGMRVISSRVCPEHDVTAFDRGSRAKEALNWIEYELDPCRDSLFRSWEDVLVIGNSLTDIPLGKAIQEKGGRFVAFHPKDIDIMKVVDHTYGDTCTLERAFQLERLFTN